MNQSKDIMDSELESMTNKVSDNKLYNEIKDLMLNDATVYSHLKMQEQYNINDFDTSVALIRSLVHENKSYSDQLIRYTQNNIMPSYILPIPSSKQKLNIWQRILVKIMTLL